jgi:integrase/recombinase XerD
MKDTDTSEKYQRVNLIVVILFAKFLDPHNLLKDINTQQDIVRFLDSKKKNEFLDPDKRWIRTWNDYLQRIKYFMRWLHNDPSVPPSEWQTPQFARIKKKKTSRISPYAESELWEREDVLAIVKYEQARRNKAITTLLWDLNARNHEVALLKIKHVRLSQRYGEAEIPHESKTGSGPALLMCSFPYVRDWLNEHPFRNEPNAYVICNLTTGSAITADTLATVMKQLRKRIIGLIQSGSITDIQEKENLERLIKTKKWNPYCIRHSAITADSDYLPEFALRKKARWVMNSKQPSRYIKARMGNDLKEKILIQNGIISDLEMQKKPSILNCSRCSLVNPVENKYCSKCSYPLTIEGYDEIKEQENLKFRSLEERLNIMQSMMEKLIGSLSKTTDQKQLNTLAESMFSSGILKSKNMLT